MTQTSKRMTERVGSEARFDRTGAALALALGLGIAVCGGTSAAPGAAAPDLSWIPAQAAVVGQFDMAALRDHPALAPLWERLAASPGAQHLDRFAAKTGVDPRTNIDRVLFFGMPDPGAGGAAIVEGTFSQDTLALFLDDALGIEREEWSARSVYLYHEGKSGREKAVTLLGPGRALVGDRDAVRMAVAVQQGQVPAISSDAHELALWQSVIDRPHSILTAVAFPDLARTDNPVLRQLKEATLTVQFDQTLAVEFLSVWPTAELAAAATNWMKATVQLHRQAEAEPPAEWRAIKEAVADSLDMTADGTVASIRVAVPATLIEERLRECALEH